MELFNVFNDIKEVASVLVPAAVIIAAVFLVTRYIVLPKVVERLEKNKEDNE